MPEPAYHRPGSLAELWTTLDAAGGEAMLLAGGTDVVPALKRGLRRPAALVDVKRIPDLQGITRSEDGGLSLGAAVTLHDVARSQAVAERWPALAEAAGTVASYQIRNRGTIGGNLCLDTRCAYYDQSAYWRREYPDCRKTGGGSCYVVPRGEGCHALTSSDLAPILLAAGASVQVESAKGGRLVRLDDLWADDGLHATTLAPGELLVRVLVPAPEEGEVLAHHRFAPRETIDFPMLSIAAAAGPRSVRLAVGHVTPRPVRVPQAEAALQSFLAGSGASSRDVGEALVAGVTMTSSVRGRVAYKKRVLSLLGGEVAEELAAAVPQSASGPRMEA